MKKVCLLSSMMVFGIAVNVNADIDYPGGITHEQAQNIKQVQWKKIRQQQELARPATYKMIDPLVEKIDWPAIFSMLDQMQGVIDVNEYRLEDNTLLILAVMTENISRAKTLLEKYKANPNVTCSQYPHTGFSPLMFACMRGDLAMVRLLLEHGANLYLTTEWGHTALKLSEQYPEIVKLLQKYTRPAKAA